jgi:hypothetical protein
MHSAFLTIALLVPVISSKREGICKLLPPLTHELAQSVTQWSKKIGPVAEHVAQAFLKAALEQGIIRNVRIRHRSDTPSLLTQSHRSKGRDALRKVKPEKIETRRQNAHGGLAAAKRGAQTKEHMRANASWVDDGSLADINFWRDVRPHLTKHSLAQLQEVTGFSLRHCSQIREGLCIPHKRHWQKLLKLIDS